MTSWTQSVRCRTVVYKQYDTHGRGVGKGFPHGCNSSGGHWGCPLPPPLFLCVILYVQITSLQSCHYRVVWVCFVWPLTNVRSVYGLPSSITHYYSLFIIHYYPLLVAVVRTFTYFWNGSFRQYWSSLIKDLNEALHLNSFENAWRHTHTHT